MHVEEQQTVLEQMALSFDTSRSFYESLEACDIDRLRQTKTSLYHHIPLYMSALTLKGNLVAELKKYPSLPRLQTLVLESTMLESTLNLGLYPRLHHVTFRNSHNLKDVFLRTNQLKELEIESYHGSFLPSVVSRQHKLVRLSIEACGIHEPMEELFANLHTLVHLKHFTWDVLYQGRRMQPVDLQLVQPLETFVCKGDTHFVRSLELWEDTAHSLQTFQFQESHSFRRFAVVDSDSHQDVAPIFSNLQRLQLRLVRPESIFAYSRWEYPLLVHLDVMEEEYRNADAGFHLSFRVMMPRLETIRVCQSKNQVVLTHCSNLKEVSLSCNAPSLTIDYAPQLHSIQLFDFHGSIHIKHPESIRTLQLVHSICSQSFSLFSQLEAVDLNFFFQHESQQFERWDELVHVPHIRLRKSVLGTFCIPEDARVEILELVHCRWEHMTLPRLSHLKEVIVYTEDPQHATTRITNDAHNPSVEIVYDQD